MNYINDIPILLILSSIVLYVTVKFIYIRLLKKNIKIGQEITIILLIAYTESLLYLTLFPTSPHIADVVSVNLVPFETINLYINFEGNISLQIINLLGNVVVFIPIGLFALSLMKKVTFATISLIGLGSTLFIEFMQLFLSIIGIISRSFDVDDLILNTLGVLIGYAVGLIGKKLFSLKTAIVQ